MLVGFFSFLLLGFFSPLCDLIIFTFVALLSAVLFELLVLCSFFSLRHCVTWCLAPQLLVDFFYTVLFYFFPSVLFDSYSPLCYFIFTSRSSLISFAPVVSWIIFSLVLLGFFSRLCYLICIPPRLS